MRKLKRGCKIAFVLWLLISVSLTSNGQVIIALLFGEKLNTDKIEFGLNGGLSQSYMSQLLSDHHSKSGFNLGLYLNFKLKTNWYFCVEAVPKFPTGVTDLKPYSLNNEGLDTLLAPGEVTRKIKNIAMPFLIRYNVKDIVLVETGPQIGLRTKAKDVFEAGDLTYENDIEDNLTRFDFGWTVGVRRKLTKDVKSTGIGLRYYLGFVDVDKFNPHKQSNSVFQVLFNIPVGTGKNANKSTAPK